MVFRAFSVLSIIMFGLCATEKLNLPVPTCKRNSSHYNSCLKRAINEAWPLFVKGLPAEFDLQPLDPYFYEYLKAVANNSNLYGEITTSNTTIEGLKMIRFIAVRSHFSDDAFRLKIDARIPKIYAEGIYDAFGTIAEFRFNGKGYFNVTIGDIGGSWDILGSVKDDTLIIKHFRITLTLKNLKLYIHNFDNPVIDELVMMFVNGNWPVLYRIVMPLAIDYWDTYFSNLLNRFFAKLSFSQVFP
ncbi:uncharacterized protein LOC116852166 [Odontomachus brunneus]|uniref:uncharacterized protein LOC116852166 n=1 Tax=Odontomachus brunneus TaxID=486640 RepID=UPI0013F20D37|nr:uncharacterized protein LOC116852166 [Odontomachus brunneus]